MVPAGDGCAFASSPSALRDNLALGNDRQAVLAAGADSAGNSWNGPGWGTAVIREIDPATAEVLRPSGGSLPATDYLTNTEDPGVGALMRPAR